MLTECTGHQQHHFAGDRPSAGLSARCPLRKPALAFLRSHAGSPKCWQVSPLTTDTRRERAEGAVPQSGIACPRIPGALEHRLARQGKLASHATHRSPSGSPGSRSASCRRPPYACSTTTSSTWRRSVSRSAPLSSGSCAAAMPCDATPTRLSVAHHRPGMHACTAAAAAPAEQAVG